MCFTFKTVLKYIVLVFLCVPVMGYAEGIVTVKKALEGSKGQMRVDSFVKVDNYHFFDTSYANHIDTPYTVKNIVTLKIDESSNIFLGATFNATVELRLIYTNSGLAVDSIDKTFDITYDSASKYISKSSFVFFGGQRVIVKILSISIGNDNGNDVDSIPSALMVENEMQIEPRYHFSCINSVITSISSSDSSFPKPDELHVWWPNVREANEYDLEWAYIDSSALAAWKYGNPASPNPDLIFENNASRITTTNLEYAIPLIYDNVGKLFFRVRAVQLNGNKRIEANWSSDFVPLGGLGQYTFRGHERALNWQSSVTFAEDGKRKVVVQYFDGSLRSRQTVTKDNTTKTTLVSESFYDFQGRAVVQVMPSPTLNTIIQYTKNFNVGLNASEYVKTKYDSLISASDYCGSGAERMDTSSGTSKYYSAANPDQTGFNKYIPDAEGYPFIQTQYTQDNTGRISKQSGVGPTYRLGSNHETKYFYSTPSQEELDGLFGTEVGHSSHYFKTMVRDANGQYSISYTDMHGRTIATALAGTPPDSIQLQSLSSNDSSQIKEILSSPESTVIKDLVMENKKALAVEKAGYYLFKYSLNPQTLQKQGCDSTTICYDCLYDLRITITDDCNNQRLPGGKVYDTTIRNFSLLSAPDTSCVHDSSFNVTLNLFLTEGSYEVTKQLSVSKPALAYYRDSIFLKKNLCKTLNQFIQQQKDSIRLRLQCFADCQTCVDSVGTWGTYRPQYMRNAGISVEDSASYRGDAWNSFQSALESCKILCDSVADNDNFRAAMLLDVTAPSGQYANPDSGWTDIYSIFYSDDPDKPSPYQRDTTRYLNQAGQPDVVFDQSVNQWVAPNKLDSAEFSKRFKAIWADSLLKYHPEYCKLIKYEQYRASHMWDRHNFEKTNTYADAVTKGFLNPTGNTNTPFNHFTSNSTFQDPLSTTTALKNSLEDKLTNYKHAGISMWSMACIMVKCESSDATCYTYYSTVVNTFDTSMCEADLNEAWKYFRQMYLQEKRFIVDSILNATCTVYTSTQLTNAHHYVHFNNSVSALSQYGLGYLTNGSGGPNTDTTSVKNNAGDAANLFYKDNCDNYVRLWIQQLSPCKYDEDSLELVIIPRLLTVCEQGTDMGHPFGASSVSPSSTYQYRSFEEVLYQYNQQHGITNSYQCNPELITSPKPYGQQVVYSEKPIISKPDSCECSNLNTLFTEYQAQGIDTSFSSFLLRTRNTVMTESDLAQLRSLCDSNSTCKFLISEIKLPPALQCYSGDICIPCLKIDSLYQKFKVLYPNVRPKYEELDTVQQYKNQLFADFMNNRLGFSKNAQDYLRFMASCSIDLPISGYADSSLCTKLTLTISFFEEATAGGAYAGMPFRGAYMSLFNEYFKINLTFEQIKELYLQICGQVPSFLTASESTYNGLDAMEDCLTFETFVTSDFDTYYGSLPDPKRYPREAFTRYFNEYFGTLYTYEQIDSMYGNTCSPFLQDLYTPFEISQEDCQDLQDVVNAFDQYYIGLSDPKLYPRTEFMNFYNYYFGTSYSYLEIDSIYQAICSQPLVSYYSYFDVGEITDCNTLDQIKQDFLNNYYPSLENPPLCTTAFETFFNSYFPASYNYVQIDSMYNVNCNDNLAICSEHDFVDSLNFDICEVFHDILDTLETHYQTLPAPRPPRSVVYTNIYNQYLVDHDYQFGPEIAFNNIAYLFQKICEETLTFATDFNTGPTLCGKSEVLLPPVDPDSISNCTDSTFFAVSIGTELYNSYLDSLKSSFEKDYVAKCMKAYQYETFSVTHNFNLYHFTLYYYDQAGNLVKTVPPKGVASSFDSTWFNTVKAARISGSTSLPSHELITQYRYNTLNQVIAQSTPDAGISKFWYDNLGRLVLSQNAKQVENDWYSYTLYDALGRIYEVGQTESFDTEFLNEGNGILDYTQYKETILGAYRTQITRTTYDEKYTPLEPAMSAKNLRNRVSWTAYYDHSDDLNNDEHATATFYTYDIHGNVDTLIQDYKHGIMNDLNNRFKKIVYKYDLVSGKVNHVAYQPREADAFYHKYHYDAENRLTNVETSKDSIHWENDAFYKYYKHGPLARAVIGQQQVQGLDYAYTLQGWLKGVNGTAIVNASGSSEDGTDMGGDGVGSSKVARDVYSYALYYYGDRDYKPINSTTPTPFAALNASITGFKPLYNGNIAVMSTHIPILGDHLANFYTYDQLNRLVGMQAHNGFNNVNNEWSGSIAAIEDYKEDISYDANGNITSYHRNGNSAQYIDMDQMDYYYYSGTNRLRYIYDKVDPSYYIDEDIDEQNDENYHYDQIGNLIYDQAEGIETIQWTVYGKISYIYNSKTNTEIWYTYDAAGNRISKRVSSNDTYTWYVRDARGNVISVYSYQEPEGPNGGELTQREIHLYGSSRLGIVKPDINVQNLAALDETYMPLLGSGITTNFTRGQKLFELSNHLGNVLATVSDKKLGHDDETLHIDYYHAEILSATDYSTYGATLPGREYNFNSTVNGFNGQLRDKQIQKDHHTALFWEYDPRTGRRWNIDPVAKSMVSPYVVLGDNPIMYVDPLGNDWYKKKGDKNDDGLVWFDGSGKHKGYNRDKRGHSFWSDRNKNGVSTWYGSNANDIQMDGGFIPGATVSAKGKSRLKWLPSAFNHTAAEEAQWSSDHANYRKGNFSGLSPEKIKMYQRWDEADKSWRQMSLGAIGIMAAPFAAMAAVETGAVYYGATLFKGTLAARASSAGGDFLIQTVMQLGQNHSIDFGNYNLSSIGSNFLMPNSSYLSALSGSSLQFSLNSGMQQSIMGSKSFNQVAFETILGGSMNKFSNASSKWLVRDGYGQFASGMITEAIGNLYSSLPATLIYNDKK